MQATSIFYFIKSSRFLSTDKSGGGLHRNEAIICGLGTRLIYDCVDWE